MSFYLTPWNEVVCMQQQVIWSECNVAVQRHMRPMWFQSYTVHSDEDYILILT